MIKNIKGLFGQYIFEVFILIGTIYFFMDEYNSNMNRYDIAIELLKSFIIALNIMTLSIKATIRVLSEEAT